MALSLCGLSGASNLGELACDVAKGVAKKIFIFNGTFSSSDYATEDSFFAAFVANALLTKTASNKILPIKEIQDIADNSEADKTGSLGLGFSQRLVEGRPKYTFKLFAGSDLLKRYRTFDNKTVRILEYDANGVLWGTKSGSNFQGYQAKITFSGGKLATGQNVEEGVVTMTVSILSNSEYLNNSYYVQIDENIEDAISLLDAPLAYVSKASNVYKYSLLIPGAALVGGGYNVLPDYGTAIAALMASFTAKSAATAALAPSGTSLAITAMAYNVGGDGLLTVTYDPTAFAAAGAFIYLAGPTVAQLNTGSVVGIEILSVVHAK
jgi:hypothetical protein